jgi:hypothetical protein
VRGAEGPLQVEDRRFGVALEEAVVGVGRIRPPEGCTSSGGELVGIKTQGKTKRTDTSVSGTCSDVLSRWVEPTAQNFCLRHVSYVFRHGRGRKHTEWAPDKLMMGASKLLVRWTDRMRPFLSSPAEEMISWLD